MGIAGRSGFNRIARFFCEFFCRTWRWIYLYSVLWCLNHCSSARKRHYDQCNIFFSFSLFFFHTIQPDHYLPSLHSLPSLPSTFLLQIHCSFVSLQRRTVLPGVSTKHSITRCNKTRLNPHNKAGWRNSVGGRVPGEHRRVRDTPTSTIRGSHKNTPSQTTSMYTEDLEYPHAGSMKSS